MNEVLNMILDSVRRGTPVKIKWGIAYPRAYQLGEWKACYGDVPSQYTGRRRWNKSHPLSSKLERATLRSTELRADR